MKTMILNSISSIEKEPLESVDLPTPSPAPKEILVKVSVCGICHTELDVGLREYNVDRILG